MANCCLECHMVYEEQHAGPYLPPALLEELKASHRELTAAGFPEGLMLRHTQWEEPIFAQYVPEEIRMQIELDHYAAAAGDMRSKKDGGT